MLGTIVNTIAIVGCGFIGLLLKNGLKERFKSIIMQGLSLCIILIGVSMAVKNMNDPHAESVLFIISIVIGSLLGEWINIEQKLQNAGDFLQRRLGSKENKIAEAFVTCSLLYCVGTMSILGSLKSGMEGDHTILFAKSVIDGTAAVIFASTLGVGALFAAIPVLIYQGMITLLASFIQPFLTTDMLREISTVGGIMLCGLGFNMMEIKKIRVGNMLPALLAPAIYYLPVTQTMLKALIGLFH